VQGNPVPDVDRLDNWRCMRGRDAKHE
jgi:hypothetical protein